MGGADVLQVTTTTLTTLAQCLASLLLRVTTKKVFVMARLSHSHVASAVYATSNWGIDHLKTGKKGCDAPASDRSCVVRFAKLFVGQNSHFQTVTLFGGGGAN